MAQPGVLGAVGCTDSFADNYNPLAIIDDGSCRYTNIGIVNDGNNVTNDGRTGDNRSGGSDPGADVVGDGGSSNTGNRNLGNGNTGSNPILTSGRFRAGFKSDPMGASAYVDGIDTGQYTPTDVVFDYKELYYPGKEFTARKTGFTGSTKYRVWSDDGQKDINGLPVVTYQIEKWDSTRNGGVGQWIGLDNLIGPNGSLQIYTFPFSFTENTPDPIDEETTTTTTTTGAPGLPQYRFDVEISSDLTDSGIIKYTTSTGLSGFLDINATLNLSLNPNPYTMDAFPDGTPPWIEFQRVGIDNTTHTVLYTIQDASYLNGRGFEEDFRKIILPGTTKITVTTSKITTVPTDTTPVLNTEKNSYEYNLNSNQTLYIPYTSSNTTKVIYSFGSIVNELSPNGSVSLKASDFTNGLGIYTVVLQPFHSQYGTGTYKQVKINVISESFREGPDITNINYPDVIRGADFKGYDENFTVSWQSVNTNYVEIYVASKANPLAKVEASGVIKLNVADVLTKANANFGETTSDIAFELLFVPFNIEGDTPLEGKTEKIKILFDKSDIKLNRGQVVQDILSAFKKSLNADIFKQYTGNYLTHYAHFGNGDNKLIITWASDEETFSEYEIQSDNTLKKVKEQKAAVFKLYEPLPGSVQPNQQFWVSKVKSLTLFEQITITENQVIDCIPLYPNLSLNLGDEIGYQILDDLVASGSQTSTQLIEEYIYKNDLSTAKLNIEYVTGSDYYWENFVKYSSAEERVENFFYKVKAIEFYKNKLTALDAAAANTLTVQNEKTRINDSINGLKKGFDAFEYFMYNESSSISYPGAGGTEVSSSSDSSVTEWYQAAIYSAQNFDKDNQDAIVNNIPVHFTQDSNNNDYMLFLNMIGNHFDIIWSYINGLQDSKKISHEVKGGVIGDLLYHMLESLGWSEKDFGIDSQPLWEYVFGLSKDGTRISAMTGKERQQEVWRRLLNNLPYFYKHKGTRRALYAIMACYGIPSSMLTIMEFGGTTESIVPEIEAVVKPTKFTYDDRTAAATFDGTAAIKVPWSGSDVHDHPACVEMRVHTRKRKEHTLISGSGMVVKVIPSGSTDNTKAKLYMETNGYSGSTDYIPFFNDEYTNVAITREVSGSNWVFNLHMKEALIDRIRNKASASLVIPTSETTWATGQDELHIGKGFDGTVDEFRLWKTALSESRIENHTLVPDAIDGNHVSASTEDLLLRFDFEYPKDLGGANAYLPNVAINRNYYTSASVSDGTIVDFTSNSTYPYQYVPYERTVTATVPSNGIGFSNKIRLQTTGSDTNLSYNSITNATKLDTTIDSNRLGLFFSPMKEINMDIIKSLGQFSIDDFIGNPADYYNDRYTDLDSLRKYYFSRYNLNIYEYIQLFRYLNKTLFKTLETLVAGRASVASGLLIEPHVLERSKIKRTKPVAENVGEDTTILVDTISLSHQMDNYTSTIDVNNIDLIAQNSYFQGLLNTQDDTVLRGDYNTHQTLIDTQEKLLISAEHKTYGLTINAQFTGSIIAEYAGSIFTSVGIDPNSISVAGFGIYGENGNVIRTYLDRNNNLIRDRKQVYLIKEQRIVNIPEPVDPLNSLAGIQLVPTTFYDYKVTFLDFGATQPAVTGSIVEVTPLNGYFPSHYRYVGDLPTGLQNSWTYGSKQTTATTLDGGAAVQTFATNPNTLLVNQTGRGSGEPILYVD